MSKAAGSGPTQKTLQSFFKGAAKPARCSPSVKSPLTATKGPAVGKSVLDGFRYRTTIGDTHAEKDGGCDVTVTTADNSASELDSPELAAANRTNVTDERTEETELQTDPYPFREDCTVSPQTKRARTEEPDFPPKYKTNTVSNHLENSPMRVDAPACLQRRAVPLQFSLEELAGNMKRLRDQQAQRTGDVLHYRRFKAKINPGENQSAEDELTKEIRWDFYLLSVSTLPRHVVNDLPFTPTVKTHSSRWRSSASLTWASS